MSVHTHHPSGTPSWYDLSTGKPQECQQFYARLFGWTFEDQGAEYGHYHMVRQDGQAVAGFMAKTPEMAGQPSTWSVYYSSDDAQADAARIRELGGQLLVEPMQVGALGVMLVATDPTGAAFGLWQPLQFQGMNLTDEHGSPTWQEVATRDASQAREFYTQLFQASSEPMPGDVVYYTLHKHGDMIGGILQMDDAHWPASIPPHWMPYFAVNDIQAAVSTAAESGGTVSVPPFESAYGTIAVLNDPDGAVFSVIQLASR